MAKDYMIDPELELDYRERGLLASIVSTEGFGILQRLMESEVAKFTVSLLNADAADDAEIVAKLRVAKAAAMFYQGVMTRVKGEVELYTHAPKASDKPIDSTEGLIDLGDTYHGGDEDFEFRY